MDPYLCQKIAKLQHSWIDRRREIVCLTLGALTFTIVLNINSLSSAAAEGVTPGDSKEQRYKLKQIPTGRWYIHSRKEKGIVGPVFCADNDG